MYEMQKLLMEDTASIKTLYRGGNHSHLGLVMNPVRYAHEAGQCFIIPPRPPATPALPRQLMSQA
eukprot:6186000-Ditylum_brightwellii.AAC.1